MNTCILMGEIVQAPQLRYTSDSQTPVAEFVVQFPGLREGDSPSQIKVVGWGNLAQDIQANYRLGDRVLLEGRINMNVVDRPEGFKEKQAEMTLQRMYSLDQLGSTPLTQGTPVNTISTVTPTPAAGAPAPMGSPSPPAAPGVEPSYDDIPF